MHNQKVLTGTILYSFLHLEVIPQGFLICNGLEPSKKDYAELYNIIQDKYGISTNPDAFKLPNLLFTYIKGTTNIESMGKIEPSAMYKHNHKSIVTDTSGVHTNQYYLPKMGRWAHNGDSGSTPKHYRANNITETTELGGEHTHDVTIVPQGTGTGSLNSYVMVPLIKY